MLYTILKFGVSAAILVAVSEIAKRSSLMASLTASLPIVSILAMIWLFHDTRDSQKVAALSTGIFWLVLPSLALFIALPVLLKRGMDFYPALGVSVLIMLGCYGGMVIILNKAGVRI